MGTGSGAAAGARLFLWTRRGRLDALVRDVLADQARRPPGVPDACDATAVRARVAALGFVLCRAEADRVAFVAGGLLNREHGFVYVRPGSAAPAPGAETLGTHLTRRDDLGGGWSTYAGH